jgi:hypothetical protein
MPNYNIKISNQKRDGILSYINTMKNNGPFTVVDVGGSIRGWSASVIDALIDINDCPNKEGGVKHFKCDITHPDSWKDILEYVEKNGKFDFCICTHTLEDIMNPGFVSEQMAKIAKAGYIATPSKHRELSRIPWELGPYRGYLHHRWIFDMDENNVFVGYPKINYLDCTDKYDSIANVKENISEISFYWKDTIDIRYINNNFLGPSGDDVIGYYNALFTMRDDLYSYT